MAQLDILLALKCTHVGSDTFLWLYSPDAVLTATLRESHVDAIDFSLWTIV